MKIYSLKENHLFSKAYAKGKKSGKRHICVYILPDYHAARLQRENPLKSRINRVGFTATKKLGGAVVRNRIKRIMREAYYRLQRTYSVKNGFIIIIAARSAAAEAKTDDVYRDMSAAFSELDMIKDKA